MNAPEKIYIFKNPITEAPDDRQLSKKSDVNDIEYVRKDAFTEKAVEWLSRHFYDEEYQSTDNEGTWICADELIQAFKEYMKG